VTPDVLSRCRGRTSSGNDQLPKGKKRKGGACATSVGELSQEKKRHYTQERKGVSYHLQLRGTGVRQIRGEGVWHSEVGVKDGPSLEGVRKHLILAAARAAHASSNA